VTSAITTQRKISSSSSCSILKIKDKTEKKTEKKMGTKEIKKD
jgi:hypothetical protein